MMSCQYRCVRNSEQIIGTPKNGRTRTVDEAARDVNLVKRRRRDLVASRGFSPSVPWTGESLNILSCGLFPRVMVASSRAPAVLRVVVIPRDRECVLPLNSHSTSPAHCGLSWSIDELARDISGRDVCVIQEGRFPGHSYSLRRLCIMKMLPGVGSGVARTSCFLTADDVLVLVPAETGRIVPRACCHGPLVEISN